VVLAKGVGEDLEVIQVRILGIGVEFDARHGQIEEDGIVNLAEGSTVMRAVSASGKFWKKATLNGLPCATLLDFGYVELQQAIDPGQQLLSISAVSLSYASAGHSLTNLDSPIVSDLRLIEDDGLANCVVPSRHHTGHKSRVRVADVVTGA